MVCVNQWWRWIGQWNDGHSEQGSIAGTEVERTMVVVSDKVRLQHGSPRR